MARGVPGREPTPFHEPNDREPGPLHDLLRGPGERVPDLTRLQLPAVSAVVLELAR